MKFWPCAFLLLCAISSSAMSTEQTKATSPYAGQQERLIKSLSQDDIRQLSSGGGWGLAKVAELNGMPGPKHLLELKDEIPLSVEQEIRIRAVFIEMQTAAVRLGTRLIALEKTLDTSFADETITLGNLNERLNSIAIVRRDLRYEHLAAHFKMLDILTQEQIENYNRLRGYDANDPCEITPEGHDPQMWKLHNGCE